MNMTAKQFKEYDELRKKSVALNVHKERRVRKYIRLLRLCWDEEIFLRWKVYISDLEHEKEGDNAGFDEPQKEEIKGNLSEIGTTKKGSKFWLDDVRLRMFLCILGETRIGKTTLLYKIISDLAEKGKRIFVLDIKGDYSGLLRLIKAVVIRAKELFINDLMPCLNTDPQQYFSCYSENFSQTMGFMQGSAFYLNEQISRLYKTNKNMTYADLELYLKSNPPKGNVEREYHQRVLNRIKQINITMPNMNVKKGYPIEQMMDEENIIVDLKGLPSISKRHIGSSILLRRFLYLINTGIRMGDVSNVIIVDEAKELFSKKNEKDLHDGQGLPILTRLSSQIGEFNTSLIVAEQIPRMLSDGIKANCGTVICFRLGSGEDIFEVSRTMNLTKEQMAAIPDLKPGQAIVRTI